MQESNIEIRLLIGVYMTFIRNQHRGTLFGGGWLTSIVFLLSIACVVLVCFLGYLLIDLGTGSKESTVSLSIIEKTHGYAYATIIVAGKVVIPQFHPQSWNVCVNIESKTSCRAVTKEFYDQTEIGQEVFVRLSYGGISQDPYVSAFTRK